MQLARSPYKDVTDEEYRLKLRQALKEKRKVWTCTSKYSISSSTLYMKNDKEARWGSACHAYMSRSRVKPEDPLLVCTEYWSNPRGKYNDFYSWIADKNISPWKKGLQNTKLVWNDGAITGLLLFDTRIDRQTFLNMQIAARLCSEWERHEAWSTLANNGIHPSLAFYFTHFMNRDGGDFYKSTLNWGGHTALPDEDMHLANFVNGTPKVDATGKMYERPCEYYCNRIWRRNGNATNTKYVHMINDAVKCVELNKDIINTPDNRAKRFQAKAPVELKLLDDQLKRLKEVSDVILKDIADGSK